MRQKCHIPIGKEYAVEIVSNKMVFDENGVVVGFEGDCINSTNKNMYRRSYVNRQRSRDNIILIGDNIGDIHMSDGRGLPEPDLHRIAQRQVTESNAGEA